MTAHLKLAAAGVALAALLAACSPGAEKAEAAATSASAVTASADVQPFRIGDLEAVALRDGGMTGVPNDNSVLAINRTPEDVAAVLTAAGLPGDSFDLSIQPLLVRDVSLLWRAIIALTIGYSAFIAEVFRAGIQSVDAGQVEAAKALGLSPFQRFRLVVMPQAIRIILPPLGNDFVAMVKDSSLVSVLGVADITQMGKIYASGSFRFFETYSIVAYVYLLLTVGLSLALRALERRLRRAQEMKGSS